MTHGRWDKTTAALGTLCLLGTSWACTERSAPHGIVPSAAEQRLAQAHAASQAAHASAGRGGTAASDGDYEHVSPALHILPARYADLVPRAPGPTDVYGNLRYEGNNLVMRGDVDAAGNARIPADAVASRWRILARNVRGVFVLRDSLFSQQDHPFASAPYALMMPPSWVTSALADLEAGHRPVAPSAPAPDDDDAWAARATAADIFGTFPASQVLIDLARTRVDAAPDDQKPLVRNARLAIASLMHDAAAMVVVAPNGPDAVARAGAERIAASDRDYFGPALRRDHVIPIFVENPTRHEYEDEGKGMSISGRDDVRATAIARARDAVFRRRLEDGDIALERYDISRPVERARAISVLEHLVPRGQPAGFAVWVWVNGPLDVDAIRGQDATEWTAAFHAELQAANVQVERVHLFSKPSADLPHDASLRRGALERAIDRFHALDLPLSLNLDTRALRRLLSTP